MQLRPFLIEKWFRDYDFQTEITLCSSGVEPFNLGEFRALVGMSGADLDSIVFRDSYSYGLPVLREAIAKRFGGPADHVIITHGSSEGLFLVLTSLLKAGDEVVAVKPAYQSHYSIAEDLGCSVKTWHLRPENGFAPDLNELKKLISNRTKAVIVNFPNNPTGTTLSRADFDDFVKIVAESGAYLLWDDAFGDLAYNAPALPDPRVFYDRSICFRTFSKAYGLAGLRVGWCQAPQDIVEMCVALRDYTTLNISPLNETIALRAIEKLHVLIESRMTLVKKNLEIASDWASEQTDFLKWVSPRGGVSSFVQLRHGTAAEFCQKLAKEKGVFLLPGDVFGMPEFFRLGFGGPTSELVDGLDRVGSFLRGASRR